MCDTLCEGVTGGVLWRERMGGRGGGTTRTHCEAPHWCVHPQVTEGWRGQPVRLEIRGGERGVSWEVLLGQSVKESGCQGSSHGHHGWTAWRFETTCLHGSHSGHDSAAHHPLHLASLCTIEPNWQTPQKPMEDWVTKSANCRHSGEF